MNSFGLSVPIIGTQVGEAATCVTSEHCLNSERDCVAASESEKVSFSTFCTEAVPGACRQADSWPTISHVAPGRRRALEKTWRHLSPRKRTPRSHKKRPIAAGLCISDPRCLACPPATAGTPMSRRICNAPAKRPRTASRSTSRSCLCPAAVGTRNASRTRPLRRRSWPNLPSRLPGASSGACASAALCLQYLLAAQTESAAPLSITLCVPQAE